MREEGRGVAAGPTATGGAPARAPSSLPSAPDAPAHAPSSPPLVEAKLAIPAERPGEIARPALVARVRTSGARVVSIVAPAGYGKTTLLRQVAYATVAEGRPVAWISLDGADDDPQQLTAYLVAALGRVDVLSAASVAAATSRAAPLRRVVLPHLAAIVGGLRTDPLIALDDVHLLRGAATADVLGLLADRLPDGAQLVMCGRGDPPLPLPRLRAAGALLEIGPDDLALDPANVARLLRDAGAAIGDDDVDVLVAATEGWPAAVYLAGLAARSDGSAVRGRRFTGRDRFMADYIRQELLDPLPTATRRFLVETCFLDQMTAPLCDAVLTRHDAATVLAELEASNRLVTPLDRERRWYRYHPLLRDALESELEAMGRERVRELAACASAWHADEGDGEGAVGYARASGDVELLAATVDRWVLPFYRAGRAEASRRWLSYFDTPDHMRRFTGLAALGAIVSALTGLPADADRWAEAAEAGPRSAEPGGATSAVASDAGVARAVGLRALMRAILCRSGPEAMVHDAEEALVALGGADPLVSAAMASRGAAFFLLDRRADAESVLVDAVNAAVPVAGVDAAIGALGALASLRSSASDWEGAREASDRALGLVATFGTEHYAVTAMALSTAARVAAHDGRRAEAERLLVRALVLRPQLTYAIPWAAVTTSLEMGLAYLGIGDVGGARSALREARTVLVRRPRLGVLARRVDELRAAVDERALETAGASSLTRAESRLLPYLPFHLTFDEIAERLGLSTHTVKTQARAIYGKLGAATRGEAVVRAMELGLLEPLPVLLDGSGARDA